MALHYLDFDYSEDADGTGTFDAIASVAQAQAHALKAEVAAVLGWAHGLWPGGCAPLDEGGTWHYDLQGAQEVSTPLQLDFDPAEGQLHAAPGAAGPPRTSLHLAISGGPGFCEAFREAFSVQ